LYEHKQETFLASKSLRKRQQQRASGLAESGVEEGCWTWGQLIGTQGCENYWLSIQLEALKIFFNSIKQVDKRYKWITCSLSA